jgi:hypothetical protein
MTDEKLTAAIEEAVQERVKDLRWRRWVLLYGFLLQLIVNVIVTHTAHKWQALATQCVSILDQATAPPISTQNNE